MFAQSPQVLMPLSQREKIDKLLVSPDGKFAVSTDWNTVILWDVASGFSIRSYNYSRSNASDITFSADSRKLAICIKDGLNIYQTATGKLDRTIKLSNVVAAWFLDETELLVACTGYIYRVNSNNGSIVSTIEGSNDRLVSYQFTTLNKKKSRLYRFYDNHIAAEDLSTGNIIHYNGTTKPSAFAEDSSGKFVAVASGNKVISLFDAISGDLIRELGAPLMVEKDGFLEPAEHYGAGSMFFINEETLFAHQGDAISIWNTVTGSAKEIALSSYYYKEHILVNDSIVALKASDSILYFNYRRQEIQSIQALPEYVRTDNFVGEFERQFSYSPAAGLLLAKDTTGMIPLLINLPGTTIKKRLDTKGVPNIRSAILADKDGMLQLFTGYENFCVGWDLRNARTFFHREHGIRYGNYSTKTSLGTTVKISPSAKWLAINFNDYFNLFNFNEVNTLELYSTKDYTLKHTIDLVERFNISDNDIMMYQRFSKPLLEISLLDLTSGKKTLISYDSTRAKVAAISPSGNYVAFMKGTTFYIYNVKEKKLTKGGSFMNWREELSDITFSADEQLVMVQGEEALEIPVFSTATGKLLRTLAPPEKDRNKILSWAAFAPGDKAVMAMMSGTLYRFNIIDPASKKWQTDYEPFSKNIANGGWGFTFRNDTLLHLVYDNDSGFRITRRIPVPGTGLSLVGDNIVVRNLNGVAWYRVMKTDTLQFVAEIYSIAPEQSLFLSTPWYTSSKEAARQLRFVKNDVIMSFDQLDVEFNRPDKVMLATGSRDTALIRSFQKAWYKRIKKLGIDSTFFRKEYSVPVADFRNRESISFEQKDSIVILSIHASDTAGYLHRFNVWVNDVPLFGMNGVILSNVNSFDTTIAVRLSEGENRIETSVVNAGGIESYRVPLYVKNTLPSPPARTYFIGIAIDHFKEDRNDLRWSVKDITDLAATLKTKYPDIFIDTLFNSRVTRSNILALKPKLQQLRPEDKLIISYSGHGLLDKDLDYYLSTYDINFNLPSQNGLAYDELEGLLDNIPPRKKLILIDACHSGEVDKEEIERIEAATKTLDSLGTKTDTANRSSIVIKKSKLGMANSFELMQNLFVNVSRGTGATIISAAGGMQYAQERGDLQNGVFTYSIIDAFNKNKTLTVSQLKKIVGESVVRLTNGLQKPTSRNETNSYDWIVW